MSSLKISRFKIKFQALENIQLPKYAGSTLRGAFGHALKNMACLTSFEKNGVCKCEPVETCLYRQLFDPPAKELSFHTRVQDIPAPFVIETYGLPENLEEGEIVDFFMTVIGEFAHNQIAIIQFAWQRALATGLGKTNKFSESAQSKLLSFDLCDQPLNTFESSSKINIQLLTHTRIQHHGRILGCHDFDIKIFCHNLARRYLSLLEIYGSEVEDNKKISEIYEDIQKIEGCVNLERVSWARWSNRQKQKMQMDGLIGCIELRHVSEDLYRCLYLGQWLHVGKGSVFGLGHYVIKS